MIYFCFHTIPPLGLEPIRPAVRHKVGCNCRSVGMWHLDVEPKEGQVSFFCLAFDFLGVLETRTFFQVLNFPLKFLQVLNVWTQIDCQDRHWNTDQKEDGTLYDRRRDGGTNSTL